MSYEQLKQYAERRGFSVSRSNQGLIRGYKYDLRRGGYLIARWISSIESIKSIIRDYRPMGGGGLRLQPVTSNRAPRQIQRFESLQRYLMANSFLIVLNENSEYREFHLMKRGRIKGVFYCLEDIISVTNTIETISMETEALPLHIGNRIQHVAGPTTPNFEYWPRGHGVRGHVYSRETCHSFIVPHQRQTNISLEEEFFGRSLSS